VADSPAAPTFQELMDPRRFPDPQRGMVVESATAQGEAVHIQTTGAEITVNPADGEIRFHQRIGHPRRVASLQVGEPLHGGQITHSGPGFARVTFDSPRLTLRVNGDSLAMLQVHQPLQVAIQRGMEVAWQASYHNHHLLVDEWGGFGLYCSEPQLEDGFDAYGETVATYPLPAEAVLWVGVCPPQPYDWERSFRDNVVWHWSNQLGYPPDEALRSWQPHGNIVLLQSEVMLWKDWNLDFVPRLGAEEFARVRRTLHDLGMRFIVYTSPYYFLKGTALEPQAMNSFENFQGWPPGSATGENMALFMDAISRVLRDYQPDGLYFDGQYIDNPAALYALARSARARLGEEGILEWHSTAALGYGECYLPHADAYVDFILRGEGQQQRYADFDYLRFFVSGYNVNNCLGVLCNNGPPGLTPELIRDVLRANARFHTLASWLDRPELMDLLNREYRPRLTPELRERVGREADDRQAQVAAKAAAARAERQTLEQPPSWGEPVFREEFDALPQVPSDVSPRNPNPFSVAEGSLHVRGQAHTFAFFHYPLKVRARGLVVRLRQGTDGGMSWGPAALLRWPDGALLRIGTRSDGKLQVDFLGQQLHGSAYDGREWIWLRARWGEKLGVVERSRDGQTYERVWTLAHGGAFTAETAELLIGKVPYSGRPEDYTEPGEASECQVDLLEVYGE
jgi:hypothetical protein